jgi:hypothetical protein
MNHPFHSLLADLSRRMGLGLAVGEQTTGIDFEVDGRSRAFF